MNIIEYYQLNEMLYQKKSNIDKYNVDYNDLSENGVNDCNDNDNDTHITIPILRDIADYKIDNNLLECIHFTNILKSFNFKVVGKEKEAEIFNRLFDVDDVDFINVF